MVVWRLVVSVAATVLLVVTGCGGGDGGGGSPEEEVKRVAREFLEAVIDDRNGEACALTTEPSECLTGLVLAKGFIGEGGYEALLGDDWREELDAADVTFAGDDHATIAPFTEDDDEGTELVRQDDEWLIVSED
jgi:hypothetical protein